MVFLGFHRALGNKYDGAATGALSDLMHDAMEHQQFAEALGYAQELTGRLAVVPGAGTPVHREYCRLRDDILRAAAVDRKEMNPAIVVP